LSDYVNGCIVSTRTGRVTASIPGAIGWADSPPPSERPYEVTLSVSPSTGPRGTRFSFALHGGLAGQEVNWAVQMAAGQPMNSRLAGGAVQLRPDGALDDTAGEFGWNTDINTAAQTYYLAVYIKGGLIQETSFAVTEGSGPGPVVAAPTVAPAVPPTPPPTDAPAVLPTLVSTELPTLPAATVPPAGCDGQAQDTTMPRLYLQEDHMSGPAVEELQLRLLELGYPLPIYGADGWFGDETDSAVRAFQERNGLDVDGIVGPITWACLKNPNAARY
jgi:hypothetical protein